MQKASSSSWQKVLEVDFQGEKTIEDKDWSLYFEVVRTFKKKGTHELNPRNQSIDNFGTIWINVLVVEFQHQQDVCTREKASTNHQFMAHKVSFVLVLAALGHCSSKETSYTNPNSVVRL